MTVMSTTQRTPAEMAERSGVTIDTLRYYEREGLLQNHRALVEAQIDERHAALRLIDHKLSFYADDQTKESR